jgi:hypothetical protein
MFSLSIVSKKAALSSSSLVAEGMGHTVSIHKSSCRLGICAGHSSRNQGQNRKRAVLGNFHRVNMDVDNGRPLFGRVLCGHLRKRLLQKAVRLKVRLFSFSYFLD